MRKGPETPPTHFVTTSVVSRRGFRTRERRCFCRRTSATQSPWKWLYPWQWGSCQQTPTCTRLLACWGLLVCTNTMFLHPARLNSTLECFSCFETFQVFLLLAACAQSPVPLSLIARALEVRPDINSAVLEGVRSCVLLFFPSRVRGEVSSAQQLPADDVETVSLYAGTRDVFRELLLGDGVTSQGRMGFACLSVDVLPCYRFNPLPTNDGACRHDLTQIPNGGLILAVNTFYVL